MSALPPLSTRKAVNLTKSPYQYSSVLVDWPIVFSLGHSLIRHLVVVFLAGGGPRIRSGSVQVDWNRSLARMAALHLRDTEVWERPASRNKRGHAHPDSLVTEGKGISYQFISDRLDRHAAVAAHRFGMTITPS
jgi:hypothetical protein